MYSMLVYYFRVSQLVEPLNEYAELERMLALRAMGFSFTVLADTFNVDRNTIRYLCRRFGLGGGKVETTTKRVAPTVRTRPQYTEEKINPGRTYAEYLAIEKQRAQERLIKLHARTQ